MMKKTKKIMVILLLIIYTNVDVVYAVTFGYNASHNIWESSSSSAPPEPTVAYEETNKSTSNTWYGSKETTITETCEYLTTTDTYVRTVIDLYDKKYDDGASSLIPSNFIFPTEYKALAGTALGVKILDVRTVYWSIKPKDIEYKKTTTITKYYDPVYHPAETKTEYTCYYDYKEPNFEFTPKLSTGDEYIKNSSGIIGNLKNETKNTVAESIELQIKCPAKIFFSEEDCKEAATNQCVYNASRTTSEEVVVREAYTDAAYETTTTTTEINQDATKTKDCRNTAVTATITSANNKLEWGAAYTINLTNSNDVNDEENKVRITAAEANDFQNQWKYYENDGTLVERTTFHSGNIEDYIDDVVSQIKTKYNDSLSDNNVVIGDAMIVERPYKKTQTCLNRITGNVTYIPGEDEQGNPKTSCDPDTEFTIEPGTDSSGDEYWYYFIPLNAKNNGKIQIDTMMDWNGTISEDLCKQYLERYPVDDSRPNEVRYTDIVVMVVDKDAKIYENFRGDYDGTNNEASYDWMKLDNMNDSDDNEDAACRLTTKIKIPITQQFYKEVTKEDEEGIETTKLHGFNFYYKPINISNASADNQVDIIFPNGVSTDGSGNLTTVTLWDDWYAAQNDGSSSTNAKSPDLTESYSTPTYYATNISASELREYNKENVYSSWKNMNINGTSNFINDFDEIITRNEDVDPTDNIYPLGCGPLNQYQYLKNLDGTNKIDTSHHPIKNIFYQEECAP